MPAQSATVGPTRGTMGAERAAFEESARYYEERDALHLTATLLGRRDEGMTRA